MLALSLALVAGAVGSWAQDSAPSETDDAPVPSFAEGAQGQVSVDVTGLMNRIDDLKAKILKDLDIQLPMELEGDLGTKDMIAQALNYGPVHDMLGVGPNYTAPEQADERYAGAFGFVFVSFSLPETSLRQLMQEADALGLPVVFRGFVGESVFETRAALERVFADAEAAPGFMIDPTLFEKFAIEHVPSVVVMPKHVALCISDECFDQLLPEHDRVDGNIPIRAALRIVAEGDGVATAEAQRMLAP